MLVLLLGPIVLRDPQGTAVEIGGPKRRAVLAALALRANRPVTVERLLDLVWDGDPPAQARAALHGHIAALRKTLPAGLSLDTLPTGYRLACDPGLVDSLAFEELHRRAQDTADLDGRSRLLQQALGLWRGGPVADLPAGEFQRTTGIRLNDLRMAALAAWADCELRRGQGARVVPPLEAALRTDGLRENLAAALIRCLAQAGRQAEALEVHRRTAALLRSELGARPGPELEAALTGVLSGELGGAAPLPAGQPSAGPGRLPRPARLVGRAEETAWLDQVARPRPGEVSLAALVGPAGVGKTALAAHWAHRAAERFPDGRLFADLRGFDEQDPQQPQDVLVGFLLALGAAADTVPAGPEERAELYDRLTRDRRLLVVLDNVRSAEDVRRLLPTGDGSAVLVTSRATLLDLVAQDGAAWRALQPLPPEDASALLSAVVGPQRVEAEPAEVRRLAELCDHLPLALRICGSRLVVRPGWTVAQLVAEIEDEQSGLDGLDALGGTGLRATLALTHRQLSAGPARLLALLGLYPGSEVDPGLAAALLGGDLASARFCLGVLALYHLIAEERPGRYTRTGLVRRYSRHLLEESVPPGERQAAFERLLDHALAASAAAAEPYSLYWWRIERPVGGPPAGTPGFGSGREAQEWFGEHEPALRFLTLEAVRLGRYEHAWRLAENLHHFYVRSDPQGHWPSVAEAGLRAAEATGTAAVIGRLESQLGVALAHGGRPELGLPRVERALAIAASSGDLHNLCVGQIRLAVCSEVLRRSPVQTRTTWEAALGLARALGERRTMAAVLQQCARLARLCGDPEGALRYAEEALGLHEVAGEDVRIWSTLERAQALHVLGRAEEALEPVRAALELAEASFLVHHDLFVAEARELLAQIHTVLDRP